jgi:tRNA1Val (adenine37-N6)-methyltransferase
MISLDSAKGIFQFKKFSVQVDSGVFPVTTDSVLLGSWVTVDGIHSALDIGCGNGILSLMIAQRSEEDCNIIALDCDEASIHCCKNNFEKSAWKEKLSCVKLDARDLLNDPSTINFNTTFNLIISNPPYFTNQLVSPKSHVTRSKHGNDFDFDLLCRIAVKFLSQTGRLCVIIPYALEEELTYKMYASSFQLARMTKVKHHENVMFSLSLIEYSRIAGSPVFDELVLFDANGKRTPAYQQLTKDFYLEVIPIN